MIYLYQTKWPKYVTSIPELDNFFPTSDKNIDIAIIAYYGNSEEENIFKSIMLQLLENSIVLKGIENQLTKNINFLDYEFDNIFKIITNNTSFSEYFYSDIVIKGDDILTKNLIESKEFIINLKKYRIYKKYGKDYQLKYPYIWELFETGKITTPLSTYFLNHSEFIMIPKIATGGIGNLATNILFKHPSVLSTLNTLAKNREITIKNVNNIEEIPYY